MDVTRGLFRAWVVVSALWIAGIVMLAWSSGMMASTWAIYNGTATVVLSVRNSILELPANSSLDNVESAARSLVATGTVMYSENHRIVEAPPEFYLDLKKQFALQHARMKRDSIRNLKTGLAIAVLPPLLLLAFGGACAWVARGFRGKKNP